LPPTVVVQVAPTIAAPPPSMVYQRPARSSCSGLLVTLVLLVIAGVAAYIWFGYNNTGSVAGVTVPNILGTGDGKLQQTFGGAGTGSGLFQDASKLAVDGAGNIYVADNKSNRIQQFDANGKFLNVWQFEGASDKGPQALAADRAGNVYICALGRTDGGI